MVGRPIVLALTAAVALGTMPALGGSAAAVSTTRLDQRYTISATLDVAAARLTALQTIELTNQARHGIEHVNLSVIPRALGYLAMDDPVLVDGAAVETTWSTTTNLRVPLGGRLAPGQRAEIVVPFVLTVGTSPDAFSARLNSQNGVISFGEWFPIVSREHDVYGIGDPQVSFTAESIRLELTTSAPLARDAVACPGLQSAPAATGTEWVCEAEAVRDFSFVVNPRFGVTERTVDDATIRVYTETVSGAATADLAQAALVGMEETFGAYPWPDLVIAEVGAGGGFSMEFPRAIHLTRTKVTDAYVVYHEVAHQWFYAQLGNDQQLEPWLDEAFADFSARLLMGIGEDQCSSRPVDSQVFDWPAGPISGGDWTSCDGYFHAVFYQGTEFLNAVRATMGDAAFFAALRDFLETHRFGVVTGRQLLDHLEAWNPAELTPIYDAYLARYDGPRIVTRRTAPPDPGRWGFAPR